MPRHSVIQEYSSALPGETATLTLDEQILSSVLENDIKRPKGYTVSWHSHPDIEKHHFGEHHPMKPWRLTLTNKIVFAYGMQTAMDLYKPRAATAQELRDFHTADYIEFLRSVTPLNAQKKMDSGEAYGFGFGDDCPVFDGLFSYCSLYTGGSLAASRSLTSNTSQIALNWSGGLHHAKKSEASGFCYINDIVLAILQLLRIHPRVLYIDIDVHHGDGVEQAFWSTNRVMTLSFHKYDPQNFFPGTGPLECTGPNHPANPGAHHSLNVPLQDGVEDDQYVRLFRTIVGEAVSTYRPSAIVLQCGGDSLGGDRLGCFNLNIKAHGACVEFTKSFRLPLLILGGGGYTARNVARLWAHETSVAIGAELNDSLPSHTPFLNHFDPDKSLYPPLSEFRKYDNRNTKAYCDNLVQGIRESLRYLEGAPSVQMQWIPPDLGPVREEVEAEIRAMRVEDDVDSVNGRKEKENGLGVPMEL